MEDRRLSLNYDVRGRGPSANRAGAGSVHPACVSQFCDDWRGVSDTSRLQTYVRRTGTGSPEWRPDDPFAQPPHRFSLHLHTVGGPVALC